MELSSLTLHQLRIFHAVARCANLTRAAEELGLSQPAVSIQIKQLERVLGITLFESVGRRQKLTDLGVIVDEHAIRILAEVDSLGQTVLEAHGVQRGRLTVGADTTVGIYVMPPLLGAWHQEHPQIEVDLRVGNHDEICRLLRNNEVDIAVVSTVPQIRGLEFEDFLPNRLVVIAPPGHSLAKAGNGRVPAQALAEQPFLVREDGSSTRLAMETFCTQAGVQLRVAMQLGSIGAIKQGVASGLGLGVVSESAVGNELAVEALMILDVEGFPLELPWHVVHQAQKRLSPSARSFRVFLQAARAVLEEPDVTRGTSPVAPRRLKETAVAAPGPHSDASEK